MYWGPESPGMTRRAVWIAVVGAVVLAGCMGGPGADPGASGPAEGGNVSSAAVPGVENGALSNATALAAANDEVIAEEGVRAEIRHVSDDFDADFRLAAGPGFETYELTGTQESGSAGAADIELWSNDSVRIVHTTAGDNESYQTVARHDDRPSGLEAVRDYLAVANFTVADESTGNGTVVLTADEAVATDRHGVLSDVEAVDARLVVEESGLIRTLAVEATDDGATGSYRFDVTETGVERVAQPAWVADLPASATLQPQLAVGIENTSYLTVANEGGDAVPAEAAVAITANDTAGQATLDAPLEAGDTRYLYVEKATGAVTLSDSQPSAGDVDPLASPVSIAIRTADGVTLHSGGMSWSTATASSSEGTSDSASGGSGSVSESESASGSETPTDEAAD